MDVEYASEFRYRNASMEPRTVIFVVSRLGETFDTLAALNEAKLRGYRVLGVTNTVGSAIARVAEGGIYQLAGIEMGDASTKAFASHLPVLSMLALLMARTRDMDAIAGHQYVRALVSLPEVTKVCLLSSVSDPRSAMYPIALEGVLKLKKVAYADAFSRAVLGC